MLFRRSFTAHVAEIRIYNTASFQVVHDAQTNVMTTPVDLIRIASSITYRVANCQYMHAYQNLAECSINTKYTYRVLWVLFEDEKSQCHFLFWRHRWPHYYPVIHVTDMYTYLALFIFKHRVEILFPLLDKDEYWNIYWYKIGLKTAIINSSVEGT